MHPPHGTPIPLRDASLYGLTRAQLRHIRFERPFRGIRVMAAPEGPRRLTLAEKILQHARYYAPLLGPGGVYSHTTALLLHGCPILPDRDVHVTVPYPRREPRHTGLVGHRVRRAWPTSEFCALPTVDIVTALVQSARLLPLRELVVAIDHMINPRLKTGQMMAREALGSALAASSLKGVVDARRAWQLGREGAESRMETLLRLELATHGIRDLELQVSLSDEQGFIGRFDLVDRPGRTIYEYDGEQHRLDRAQYLKDLVRLERVRAAGWRVIRFHHEDLFGARERVRAKLRG